MKKLLVVLLLVSTCAAKAPRPPDPFAHHFSFLAAMFQGTRTGGGSSGGGTPGGSDKQVQFNDGGVFGGSANMTFDKTTGVFSLLGGTGSPGLLCGSGSATVPCSLEADSGDAASNGEPAYIKLGTSPANTRFNYLYPCSAAGRFAMSGTVPAADCATTLADYIAQISDSQTQLGVYYADTGAADAYVITPNPAIAAYATGQRFVFKPTNANATGTPTIAISGLATKTLTYKGGTVPIGFLTPTLCLAQLMYDGTNFEIVSSSCSPIASAYFVAANFTSAGNTNLQTITGLSWTFPALAALKVKVDCDLLYSIATAAVAVDFGFTDTTVAPTNLNATGEIYTNTTVVTEATLQNSSTTTATSIVSATPSAITTIWQAHLHLFIEQPSNASTSVFAIQVKTANAADLPTVYRGSACSVTQ